MCAPSFPKVLLGKPRRAYLSKNVPFHPFSASLFGRAGSVKIVVDHGIPEVLQLWRIFKTVQVQEGPSTAARLSRSGETINIVVVQHSLSTASTVIKWAQTALCRSLGSSDSLDRWEPRTAGPQSGHWPQPDRLESTVRMNL